jgi:PAS domain S-box-containing protein
MGEPSQHAFEAARASPPRGPDPRQESIFDSAKDGILTLDEEGSIESLNPAAARMYGYEEHELVQSRRRPAVRDAPGQEEVEAFLKAVQRPPQGDVGRIEEFPCRRKDVTTFPADVPSARRAADGMHYVAIVRDISERKQIGADEDDSSPP